MISRVKAERLIEDVPRQEIEHFPWGNTRNIQWVIMHVVDKDNLQRQVARFAKGLEAKSPAAQYEGLRQLWRFCRLNIRYQEDKEGEQLVKHPARIWEEKVGDCKSLTVFIYFVCRAMGVPCFIRFASYEKGKRIQHVYPVAILGRRAVPIDAVWHRFDSEKKPTYYEDYLPAVWSDDPALKEVMTEATPAAISGADSIKIPKWLKNTLLGVAALWLIREL